MPFSDTQVWETDEAQYPAKGSVEERLAFLLNYAVMAPSGHNAQPWLFRIYDNIVELYADRTRALAVADPDDRELTISCGAALFNLKTAARHFGFFPSVEVFPAQENPDLLARMTVKDGAGPDHASVALFGAIKNRRTNRMPFEDRPVPPEVVKSLKKCASEERAWLHVIEASRDKAAAADLISEGDSAQAADARFRRELAAWVHPNRTRSRDGIPGYALGITDSFSYIGPLVIRTFNWGKGQAAKDRQLAEGSPLLAVIGTDADTPSAWFAAGQALEKVLLEAASKDVCSSFLNQPIEVPILRPQLSALIGTHGYPQLLLRMGYGAEVKPTPRRSVREVILSE